ncbi:MAG: selenium metabolism-associated LysR family transcriptional regulator [Thermodesulfobacteriota bacterium]|nr:selenium metabolism-associated LysR family transcriptional regulator [Thermodesulfobacteriota bacterium]
MDIRRLEAFAKVYELKSFSKAAKDIFLSQPTISAHISALEKELGVRLFDRLGRSILPTQAAEILYKYAQSAFDSLAGAKAEIGLLQKRVSGELSVGGSTIPAHYMLPGILSRFLAKYPDVTTYLAIGDTGRIIDRVAGGDLAVGMVGAREDSRDLEFVPVLEDDLVVIAPPGTAPGVDAEIKAKDLFDFPWVIREPGSGTWEAFEKALVPIGLDIRNLRAVVCVESTRAVLECVRAGLGFSVTSRLVARSFLESGEAVEVHVKDLAMRRGFYLAYHKRRYFFPVVRYFIDFVRQEGGREFL